MSGERIPCGHERSCNKYLNGCDGKIIYIESTSRYVGNSGAGKNECATAVGLTFQRRQTETLDEIAKKVLNLQ